MSQWFERARLWAGQVGPAGWLVALQRRLRVIQERGHASRRERRVAWMTRDADTRRFELLWPEDQTAALIGAAAGRGPTRGKATDLALDGYLMGLPGPAPRAPFPWNKDPVTEESFARRPWMRLWSRGDLEVETLRLAREPGRLQVAALMVALGRLEADPELLAQGVGLTQDFLRHNPFLETIHWLRAEDVALRTLSLVWIRALVGPDLDERLPGVDLARAVFLHQYYLDRFASEGLAEGFEGLTSAAAQLVASLACPWFRSSERWAEQAAHELSEAVLALTLPDGVGRTRRSDHDEMGLELALFAGRVAEHHGLAMGEAFWDRVHAMATWYLAWHQVDRPATRSGDMSGGVASNLPHGETSSHRALLASAALHFEEPEWARLVGDLTPGGLLFHGEVGAGAVFDDWTSDTLVEPLIPPEIFPKGGQFFFRSTQDPRITIGFDAGDHGLAPTWQGAHADALGVTLEVGRRPVVADPGHYLLRRREGWQQYLRSTGAHSTVRLNWDSSSVPGPGGLWYRAADGVDRGYAVNTTSRLIMATASQTGYSEVDGTVTHRRTVMRDGGNSCHFALEDHVFGSLRDEVAFELLFHLHPDVAAIHQYRDLYQVPCGNSTLNFRFASDHEGLEVAATKGHEKPFLGWYASTPARIEPCWVLRVSLKARLPILVRTAIFPT